MDPDLQKQLAELLAKLMVVAEDGAKWAGQQIPPLVREKIAFGRAWETTAFVLLAIAAGIGAFYLVRLVKHTIREDDDLAPAVFVSLIGELFVAAQCVEHLRAAMLVWFAPRLYIVEWLRDMVKQ